MSGWLHQPDMRTEGKSAGRRLNSVNNLLGYTSNPTYRTPADPGIMPWSPSKGHAHPAWRATTFSPWEKVVQSTG